MALGRVCGLVWVKNHERDLIHHNTGVFSTNVFTSSATWPLVVCCYESTAPGGQKAIENKFISSEFPWFTSNSLLLGKRCVSHADRTKKITQDITSFAMRYFQLEDISIFGKVLRIAVSMDAYEVFHYKLTLKDQNTTRYILCYAYI